LIGWTKYQKLFLFLLCGLVIKATGLNDLVVDIKLIPGSGIHGFFNTLLRDETQNANSFGLANSMSTILGLKVGVRIPRESQSLT
jgi:hypothetical protein